MKAVKYLAGAAAAAALTVAAAGPAQAQYGDPYRSNRGGIDVGDIITGVAVLGGIQAILGAFNRDGGRYGYGNQYRYRNDYQNAVNSCGYEAQRYVQAGQVSVTDVDRRGANSYRVRGVINAGYGNYGSYGRNDRYDRYDRYNRYDRNDDRYGGYDRNDDRYGGYDRNDGRYGGYDRYDQRVAFACTARSNGRVTDFDIDRRY